jgi:hypothetical protein
MRRDDLHWALNAVIPHAGKKDSASVGLTADGTSARIYATDQYTLGIARIDAGLNISSMHLPLKEATDLMRFVRPNKVAEQSEHLAFALQNAEFHVATDQDSAVYETVQSNLTVDYLSDFITRLAVAPKEWDELIYQPELITRFVKAKRLETDRLRIQPRHSIDMYGAAIITVGDDFVGAVAGLAYDDLGPNVVSSFLAELSAA